MTAELEMEVERLQHICAESADNILSLWMENTALRQHIQKLEGSTDAHMLARLAEMYCTEEDWKNAGVKRDD